MMLISGGSTEEFKNLQAMSIEDYIVRFGLYIDEIKSNAGSN